MDTTETDTTPRETATRDISRRDEVERRAADRRHDESPGDEGRRVERVAAARRDSAMQVRAADLEPYVGLRYVAKLFRLIALILLMLLVAEVAVGLYQQGWQAVPTLLAEGSRLLVLGGLLWGAGDLAMLMIDVGHDVRATRILIGRQQAHTSAETGRQTAETPLAEPRVDTEPLGGSEARSVRGAADRRV